MEGIVKTKNNSFIIKGPEESKAFRNHTTVWNNNGKAGIHDNFGTKIEMSPQILKKIAELLR